ncbi:Actin-like protein arp9, partial [Cryomyces antarcticus]
MPPFKDEQILLIAPGSQTTLAQLGLPESFTPARLRFRSRMFPADKAGEYEPNKVRRKQQKHASLANGAGTQDGAPTAGESDNEAAYEEDPISEDGAVWPIEGGRVTDWPCFFALIEHIYMSINPSFHTPILLLTPPVWTPREHEKITQFFFEKFKTPAFGLMDSAMATAWAYGLHTATVVDMGLAKTDVTAISEFIAHDVGRATAVPDCGGEALTQRLFELLGPQGLTRDMCEQLKRNPICEVLPLGASLPGPEKDGAFNPASAASTGANGSGPDQRTSAGALGDAPRGPGPDTEVGEETNEDEDNEGILDVASIVTSGKMSEYLAKKEREKAERAAAKKKGGDAAAAAARPARLPNSRRERNTFVYEDHALLDALKNMNMNGEKM